MPQLPASGASLQSARLTLVAPSRPPKNKKKSAEVFDQLTTREAPHSAPMGRRGGTYRSSASTSATTLKSLKRRSQQDHAGKGKAANGVGPHSGKRFVFQSFSERISELDVSVAHEIIRQQESAKGTYFLTRLDELRTQDRGQHFGDFVQDVYLYVQSLPMLLHHLDKITGALLHHLSIEQSSCVPHLLDLISLLARDMRGEFYPYFYRISKSIIALLRHNTDVSQIEASFRCFAYLFKFLAKQLVDDVPRLIRLVFQSLLGHPKSFIRRFAAESLAFLLKRVRKTQMRLALHTVLAPVATHASAALRDGLSRVLFQLLRGVSSGLHTQAKQWIPLMLRSFSTSSAPLSLTPAARDELLRMRFYVVAGALRHTCEHLVPPGLAGRQDDALGAGRESHARHCSMVVRSIARRVSKLVKRIAPSCSLQGKTAQHTSTQHMSTQETKQMPAQQIATQQVELARVVILAERWALHRGGSRVQSPAPLLAISDQVCRKNWTSRPLLRAQERFAAALYRLAFGNRAGIPTAAAENAMRGASIQTLRNLLGVGSAASQLITRLEETRMEPDTCVEALACVSGLASSRSLLLNCEDEPPESFWPHGQRHHNSAQSVVVSVVRRTFENKTTLPRTAVDLASFSVCARLVPLLSDRPNVAPMLWQIASRAYARSDLCFGSVAARAWARALWFTNDQGDVTRQIARSNAIQVLLDSGAVAANPDHCGTAQAYRDILLVVNRLANNATATGDSKTAHGDATRVTQSLMHVIIDPLQSKFTRIPSTTQLSMAERWLTHPDLAMRRAAVGALSLMSWSNRHDANIITLMSCAVPLDTAVRLDDERPIALRLQRLGVSASEEKPSRVCKKLVVAYLLGILRVKLSPLWSPARNALGEIAQREPALVWEFLQPHLQTTRKLATLLAPLPRKSDWRQYADSVPGNDQDDGQILNDIDARRAEALRRSVDIETPFTAVAEKLRALGRAEAARAAAAPIYSTRAPEHFPLVRSWSDHHMAEMQLLQALASTEAALVWKQPGAAQWLVSYFIRFVTEEHDLIFAEEPAGDPTVSPSTRTKTERAERVARGARAQGQDTLRAMLQVVQRGVTRPTKLSGAAGPAIRSIITTLLSKRDPSIQSLALQILCQWKAVEPCGAAHPDSKTLAKYKSHLLSLADDRTMRQGIINFSLGRGAGAIADADRPVVVPAVIRVLYPKILRRRIAGSGASVKKRRAMLFAYLGSLEPSELEFLVRLLLRPFRGAVVGGDQDDVFDVVFKTSGPTVTPAIQIGFLSTAAILFKQLRMSLEAHAPTLLTVAIALYRSAVDAIPQSRRAMDVCQDTKREETDHDELDDGGSDDDGLDNDSELDNNDELGKDDELDKDGLDKDGLDKDELDKDELDKDDLDKDELDKDELDDPRSDDEKGSQDLKSDDKGYDDKESDDEGFDEDEKGENDKESGDKVATVATSSKCSNREHNVQIRRLACRLLSQLVQQYPNSPLGRQIEAFVASAAPRIRALQQTLRTGFPSLLGTLQTLSAHESWRRVFAGLHNDKIAESRLGPSFDLTRALCAAAAANPYNSKGCEAICTILSNLANDPTLSQYFATALDPILEHLAHVLSTLWQDGPRRRGAPTTPWAAGARRVRLRALKVVLVLARQHGATPAAATRMLRLITPLLAPTTAVLKATADVTQPSPAVRTALQTLRVAHAAVHAAAADSQAAARAASVLLQSVRPLEARRLVCEMVLHAADAVQKPIAAILCDLHAADTDNPLAHERGRNVLAVIETYNNTSSALAKAARAADGDAAALEEAARPLAFAILFDLCSDERSIRSGALVAADALLATLHRAGPDGPTPRLVSVTLLAGVRRGLQSPHEAARAVCARLLKRMLQKFPTGPLSPYVCLTHDTLDLDFLHEITHIQLHRRSRALTRAAAAQLGERAIADVVLPACMRIVRDAKVNSRRKGFHTLVDAAAQAQARVCAKLPWPRYLRHLQDLVRSGMRRPAFFKTAMRCVLLALDQFSYFDGAHAQMPNTDSQTQTQIAQAVQSRLVPLLSKRLLIGTEGQGIRAQRVVRTPVALALVRLLLKTPRKVLDHHFPPLALKLIQQLRNKVQSTRDRTRHAIADALKLVGPRYLSYVSKEICAALSRGYMLQVRQVALHTTVERLCESSECARGSGAVDHALPFLIRTILEDILGEAAEIRRVESIARTLSEARETKSYATLELLSAAVNVPASQGTTGSPVMMKSGDAATSWLPTGPTSSNKKKGQQKATVGPADAADPASASSSQQTPSRTGVYVIIDALSQAARAARALDERKIVHRAFRHVARGLAVNPSLSAEARLVLVYPLLSLDGDVHGDSFGDDIASGDDSLGNGSSLGDDPSAAMKKATDAQPWQGLGDVQARQQAQSERRERAERARRYLEKKRQGLVRSGKEEAFAINPTRSLGAPVKAQRAGGGEEVAIFAMRVLLHGFAKRGGFNHVPKGMLKPLLERLVRLCGGPGGARSSALQAQLLEAAAALFRNHASSLSEITKSHVDTLAEFMFDRMQSSDPEILSKSFRGVTAIVRHCALFKPTKPQLQLLMSFVRQHLESVASQGLALILFKSIVARKHVSADVYDTIDSVAGLVVRARDPAVRRQAQELMLMFLLDYPMGEKRLRTHVHFLLNNLSYERADGRTSVLELVHQIACKFPAPLLASFSQLIFLPLVLRLANDDDDACRKMAAETLRVLMRRVGGAERAGDSVRASQLNSFVDHALRWLQPGAAPALRKAGAQVAGLVAQAAEASFVPLFDKVVPVLCGVLDNELPRLEREEAVPGEKKDVDERRRRWGLMHLCLVSLEHAQAALLAADGGKGGKLLRKAQEKARVRLHRLGARALRFPHVWVRLAGARVLGRALAAGYEDDGGETWAANAARACVAVLASDVYLVQELGQQAAKNALRLCLEVGPADRRALLSQLAKLARRPPAPVSAEALAATAQQPTAAWVTRRTCAYQLVAALLGQLPTDEARELLLVTLPPLHAAADGRAAPLGPGGTPRPGSQQLQSLAQQALELVEQKVGGEAFASAYARVAAAANDARTSRARQRKVEKVADPANAARRKQSRTQRQKRARKRKQAVRKAVRDGTLPEEFFENRGQKKKARKKGPHAHVLKH